MYGFTPSPTTEKLDRPPPENRSSRPNRALPLKNCASWALSTPGTGTWARNRKTIRIPATNRIRRRMSGARKAFSSDSNTVRRLRSGRAESGLGRLASPAGGSHRARGGVGGGRVFGLGRLARFGRALRLGFGGRGRRRRRRGRRLSAAGLRPRRPSRPLRPSAALALCRVAAFGLGRVRPAAARRPRPLRSAAARLAVRPRSAWRPRRGRGCRRRAPGAASVGTSRPTPAAAGASILVGPSLNASATTNRAVDSSPGAEDLERLLERPNEADGAQDLLVDRDRRRALASALAPAPASSPRLERAAARRAAAIAPMLTTS